VTQRRTPETLANGILLICTIVYSLLHAFAMNVSLI
jgi:hypothetical protein